MKMHPIVFLIWNLKLGAMEAPMLLLGMPADARKTKPPTALMYVTLFGLRGADDGKSPNLFP